MLSDPNILFTFEAPLKKGRYPNSLPPLGILSLAAVLRDKGFKVSVYDGFSKVGPYNPADYDIIGFSVNISNVGGSLSAIRAAKKANPNVHIIVGGPKASTYPEYFARMLEVDAVCIGEAEESILEYMDAIKNGKQDPVNGFHFKNKDGKMIIGEPRTPPQDLDSLPFPAMDLVDLKDYNIPIRKVSPISQIQTSRGCPYGCIFCDHTMGREWRPRSPENVVDEIEWHVTKLGAKGIFFGDDNFTMDIERAKRICELIIERNLKFHIRFLGGVRVDRMDRELITLLRKAGCWLLVVSPETGSPRLLKQIKKQFDHEKVKQVVRWCREEGINIYACFVVGFPFETDDDIEMTIKYAQEIDPDFIQVARVVPYRGTELYDMMGITETDEEFATERGYFFDSSIPAPVATMAGTRTSRELDNLISRINRKFYLNPKRARRILKILPLKEFIRLLVYTLSTKNI